MQARQRHIRSLDTLRGVAALAVFTAHYLQQFIGAHFMETAGGRALEMAGSWGVSVFFVLSGFVIHGGTLLAPPDWTRYCRRRFFRIVPAYFAALAVCSGVGQYAVSDQITPASWPAFLTHLFLVSCFDSDHLFAINGVFWSVVIECHFYLAYPLLRPLLTRLGAPRFALLAIVLGWGLFVAASLVVPSGSTRNMLQNLAPVLFWKWALGVVLAEMFHRGVLPALTRLCAHRAVLPVAFTMSFLIGALPQGALRLNYERFFLPFFCFMLVGGLLFSPARRFRSAVGEHLGDISYSIYLWHPLALLIALHLTDMPLSALGVSLAGVLLLSEASHRFIERPFQSLPRLLWPAAPSYQQAP